MIKPFLQKVEDYVRSILETKTPPQNIYHDFTHTKDVAESSIEIGIGEKLTEEDLEIVQISAWFHDIGYIQKTKGHEKISIMYARDFLRDNHYPLEKTKKIIGCILATKVPQNPKNKLEKIVCDSDLNHIGRETFFERNDKYRVEYENYLGRKLTDYEWITKTIDFVSNHIFFTDYTQKKFSKQKEKNLRILRSQLQAVTQPK